MKLTKMLPATVLAFGLPVSASASTFDIEVIFGGGLSTSQQAIFTTAETFWESVVTGYQSSALGDLVDGLQINAAGVAIDGAGGVLGSAGPTALESDADHVVASSGIMQFDTADLDALEAAGTLLDVIMHEMAHVMGLGTLWTFNDVYVAGSGEYTGAFGLAEYQNEFDPLATFIPVELDGGPGTADAHWDEDWAGGFREIMTGFLDSPVFVSDTTIASFADIGYTVNLGGGPVAPIPLPAGGLLLLGAFGALGAVRARRKPAARV